QQQLQLQQRQTQPQNDHRSSLKDSTKVGATDLLAQMLDAKYSRQIKTAASPNNGHHKNGRDTAGSPFVMAAATAASFETSPVSKQSSFVYPPNAGGFYGKQASGIYGRDTPVMANMNGVRDSISSNLYGKPASSTASPVMAAEQTEAISLVVGPAKKRRNKVTDSRLPVRTPTRITRNDEHLRETSSVSPPLLSNGGSVHFPAAAATEFFDPTAINANSTTFPFAEHTAAAAARLAGTLFNVDDVDQLKNTTTNCSSVNGAATGGTDAVANAVAAAATAHHLRMFVASRASPDSMSGGYPGAVLSSYGRGSGTGSENGGDGSETNDTQSLYDPSMPMISFSNNQFPSLTSYSDSISLTSLHTSTLSPMHLRKAKLMFFYVRYPKQHRAIGQMVLEFPGESGWASFIHDCCSFLEGNQLYLYVVRGCSCAMTDNKKSQTTYSLIVFKAFVPTMQIVPGSSRASDPRARIQARARARAQSPFSMLMYCPRNIPQRGDTNIKKAKRERPLSYYYYYYYGTVGSRALYNLVVVVVVVGRLS
ncbi:hypothetical protein BLA29_002369, partial [Euroglyphus maynei]